MNPLKIARAADGVRPRCSACGLSAAAFRQVRPVIQAGPLRLFACPACGKRSFRQEATAAAVADVELPTWLRIPAPVRRVA